MTTYKGLYHNESLRLRGWDYRQLIKFFKKNELGTNSTAVFFATTASYGKTYQIKPVTNCNRFQSLMHFFYSPFALLMVYIHFYYLN